LSHPFLHVRAPRHSAGAVRSHDAGQGAKIRQSSAGEEAATVVVDGVERRLALVARIGVTLRHSHGGRHPNTVQVTHFSLRFFLFLLFLIRNTGERNVSSEMNRLRKREFIEETGSTWDIILYKILITGGPHSPPKHID